MIPFISSFLLLWLSIVESSDSGLKGSASNKILPSNSVSQAGVTGAVKAAIPIITAPSRSSVPLRGPPRPSPSRKPDDVETVVQVVVVTQVVSKPPIQRPTPSKSTTTVVKTTTTNPPKPSPSKPTSTSKPSTNTHKTTSSKTSSSPSISKTSTIKSTSTKPSGSSRSSKSTSSVSSSARRKRFKPFNLKDYYTAPDPKKTRLPFEEREILRKAQSNEGQFIRPVVASLALFLLPALFLL